jgi:hypothetical protein
MATTRLLPCEAGEGDHEVVEGVELQFILTAPSHKARRRRAGGWRGR